MIVTFSVSNFRSFRDEQTLSLVAAHRQEDENSKHLVKIPDSDKYVLRAAVIYGANGAGKSNLMKAIRRLQKLALENPARSGVSSPQFHRPQSAELEKSLFDIQFISNGKLYHYGIVVQKDIVLEEWLTRVKNNRESLVFERTTEFEDTFVEKGPASGKKLNKKLEAAFTIGAKKNRSFLSTVRENLNSSDYEGPIYDAIDWFRFGVNFVEPDKPILPLGVTLNENEDFLKFSSDLLKNAATGIDHLKVSKEFISEEQLKMILPATVAEDIVNNSENTGNFIYSLPDGREIFVEHEGDDKFSLLNIRSIHEDGDQTAFDLSDESDGTKRFLNLSPALHELHTSGGVYVIDEVERSIHPLLIWKFIEVFFKGCGGENRQLIITTHESNLLNQDLLRRDEVWFTEKDRNGSTSLFSLSEFKPRKDLKIDSHYLKGRFGAIPFLSGLDDFISKSLSDHD